MAVRTILVCEAQVPLVRGGAEIHVRELVDRLRERGYAADLVSVPFKWYPKDEILAHAAAWRLLDLSESNGTPIDLVIAHEVPVVLRPAPEQGRVAHPPVPRGLRAVRHRVQRLRARGSRRRAAAADHRPRHGDARRVPAALHERPEHRGPPREVQRAARRSRCIIPRGWPTGSRAGPPATTSCRSGGSRRSSGIDLALRALAPGAAARAAGDRRRGHAARRTCAGSRRSSASATA